MEYFEICINLKLVLEKASKGSGQIMILRGESGIGKSFIANKFLSELPEDHFIMRIKTSPTAKENLSSIYESLYNILSHEDLKKAKFVTLVKKYTKLIPGFGRYISPLIEITDREAISSILTISEIEIGHSPNPHIYNLVKEVSSDRLLIIFCDDIQWLDSSSWQFVVYLSSLIKNTRTLIIMAYNDHVSTWCEKDEKEDTIEYWRSHPDEFNLSSLGLERWREKNLSILIKDILGKSCTLSKAQLKAIYDRSRGVPLYVKSMLDFLVEEGYIKKEKENFVGIGDWNKIDLWATLRKTISHKIERVYKKIPESRAILEVGSVLGNQFNDGDIDSILYLCNSYVVLSKIESEYAIVKYLFDFRMWEFEHSLIREAIYKSLCFESSKLHLKVAEFLDINRPDEYLGIAYHYKKAGFLKESISYKMKEIQQLINRSLFESAYQLVRDCDAEIENDPSILDDEKVTQFIFLKGKTLYYRTKYKEALEQFQRVGQMSLSEVRFAEYHRWLGKCFIKLDSQEDFEYGRIHLEDAAKTYLSQEDYKNLGRTHTDLVVAYAHLNKFEEAEKAYVNAEKYLNIAKDSIGMACLQRRSMIFMDRKFSIPILLKIAESFKKYGILHERIMALNNAATEYMYLNDLQKAKEILERALTDSVDLGDFGASYLYNNLGIIYIYLGEYNKSLECFDFAIENSNREILNLIIAVNRSVPLMKLNGPNATLSHLERTFRKALAVGEKTYALSAAINLAYANIVLENYTKALSILENIGPMDPKYSYSSYKNTKWYKLLYEVCEKIGDSEALSNLEKKYSWCLEEKKGIFYEPLFSIIDMQYWSD